MRFGETLRLKFQEIWLNGLSRLNSNNQLDWTITTAIQEKEKMELGSSNRHDLMLSPQGILEERSYFPEAFTSTSTADSEHSWD